MKLFVSYSYRSEKGTGFGMTHVETNVQQTLSFEDLINIKDKIAESLTQNGIWDPEVVILFYQVMYKI